MRSLSVSSGDEGRIGPFRGEEDMDHIEFSPVRMVDADWPGPYGSALDAATRVVRESNGRGPPRTGAPRIRGRDFYRRLDDDRLLEEMQHVQTELHRRFGTPSTSDASDTEERDWSAEEKSLTESE